MHDVVNQILNETSKRVAAIKGPDQDEHDMKKDNKRDIDDIPQNIRKQLEFVLVSNMDEVLEHALIMDKSEKNSK